MKYAKYSLLVQGGTSLGGGGGGILNRIVIIFDYENNTLFKNSLGDCLENTV